MDKIRVVRRRRRKKKISKKKKPIQQLQEFSDTEVQIRKTKRSISVFDLIPTDTLNSEIFTRRSKTPQPRVLTEKKCTTTSQLTEVQAKLYTLKNKLWFGIGSGDVPLSWGSRNIYIPDGREEMPQKKKQMKKIKKSDKAEKKCSKEKKPKVDQKEKAGKNQNGLQRQVAVDWSGQNEKIKIRKSKSLPDTSCSDLTRDRNKAAESGDEEKRERKKKKKRGKFAKKAKVLSNANKAFTRKD